MIAAIDQEKLEISSINFYLDWFLLVENKTQTFFISIKEFHSLLSFFLCHGNSILISRIRVRMFNTIQTF